MISFIDFLFYRPGNKLFCLWAVLCIPGSWVFSQSLHPGINAIDTIKGGTIDTVSVNANAIDLYDKLVQLRDKNRLSFLNNDSDIYYSYSYRCINLKDSTVIDSAY